MSVKIAGKLPDPFLKEDGSRMTPEEWYAAREEIFAKIVETEFGYHLIYFVSTCDESYRDHMMTHTMREDDYSKWHGDIVDAVTATVLDTSLLELNFVISRG